MPMGSRGQFGAAPQPRVFRFPVPSVGNLDGFANLVALRKSLPRGVRVVLDFGSCNKLTQNAIIFLGGLVALIKAEAGSVQIFEATLKPKMRERLTTSGMLAHFGSTNSLGPAGVLPFEQYLYPDKTKIMNYLEARWLGSGAVQLSPNLRAAIMGNAWEVYANAFEHSDSSIGVVNSGSFNKKTHKLELLVMDLGIGIPESVRRFHSNQPIHPGRALRWAFSDGTSTRAEAVGYSRGIGLHTLKEFIKLNKGSMEVFSNDGYARITHSKETYRRQPFNFPGTLVHITLSADERFYCFEEELPKYRSVLGQWSRQHD